MLIGLNDLPEALRKHVSTLRACVKLALDDFVSHHTKLRNRYSLRTEASLINDYMIWYAKDRFPWNLKRNLFLIDIANDYRAKLKKLNGRWQTSNIQTNLVLQFEHQRPLRLFDDLDLTHLFLGYQRDVAEITRSSIWLVCPDGKSFKWIAELTADEGSGAMEFAVTAPTDPMADTDARRIKPRIVTEGETAEGAKDDDKE